jgi:hypothetical protein
VTRYRDPERAKGNLPEGATPVEFVPVPKPLGRAYSFEDELARQRALNPHSQRFYAPRAPRPTASFNKYRSLRRV